MKVRIASAWLVALGFVVGSACAEEAGAPADIQQGHRLALEICAYCHLSAGDQETAPILQPPAPSFASIAQRRDIGPDSLRAFLNTTHRSVAARSGMPNPELLDSQIKQVAAYLLSLRNKP